MKYNMVNLFALTLKLFRLCRVIENPCTVQLVKKFSAFIG